MGGFLGGIGAAAQGFEQAHHDEMQREFATEQGNRQAALEMFRTFALDPNQPDELRQAAFQSWQNVAQTPYGKFKLEKHVAPFQELIGQHNARKILGQAPPPPTSVQTPAMQAGGPPQFTPSTEGPPQMSGGQLNLPATTSSVQGPPPPPPNLFGGYPEMAQGAKMLAGAQAEAEAGPPIMRYGPNGEMQTVIPSKQPGQTFENTFNPVMLRGLAAMMHPVQYSDPQTGQPLLGMQNKLTQEIYGQDGELLPPGTVAFAPSLVSKTQTETMSPSGAVTRKTTPQPNTPGGTRGAAVPTKAGTSGTPANPTNATRASQLPAQLPRKPEDWQKIRDPITLDAIDWATQGRHPVGGPMAERQVRARMAQLGLAPALPIPPAMQQKIQESFVARNSAIDLIDDIMANKKVLDSALTAGKIALASDPDGNGILTRAANLTDQEARVAGDFQQLIEHANLLRGPLGATGFRGKEAWGALQAQRGKPLADPRITSQVMTGMRSRLVGLNSADKLVLGGQGMGGAAADPYEGRIAVGPNGHQIKWTNGQWVDAKTGAAIQ